MLAFEGRLSLEEEDGGRALLGRVGDGEDEGMFVQLQSWSEEPGGPAHADIRSLEGRRVRVTVETLD